MNPLTIISDLGGAINSWLNDKLVHDWGVAVQQTIVLFASMIIRGLNGLVYARAQEGGAVTYSDTYALDIAKGIVQTEAHLQDAISHVAFTILPRSLAVFEGDIYNGWIKPMGDHIQALLYDAQYFAKHIADLESWVYGWVVPEVKGLNKFMADFYAGDQPAINTLVSWLRKPEDWANYAAPYLAWPLAGYLTRKDTRDVRDGWAYLMVDAWAEEPQAILDAVQRWLLQPIR